MGYEIFARKIVRSVVPAISISSLGKISLNKAFATLFQENRIEFVLLLWDKEEQKMAIRQADKTDNRAYRISFTPKGRGAAFSAKTFFQHIKYDFAATRSFTATWNSRDKMFEIGLRPNEIESKQPQRRKPGRPKKVVVSL